MKKILVLGAAQSCVGIIKKVKQLGYKSVVVGNSSDLPGKQYADYYLIAEDNDVESVVSYCKKIGVDGIVPVPVDRPLVWMSIVAEKLGLIFISPEVAHNFRHKYKMKQCLQRVGIKCAKGILTSREIFSTNLISEILFPMIIKPIDGYASRGVIRVNTLKELESSIPEVISFSSDSLFIIEEFIAGREFNAEGVCYNGDVEIYAIVEKIRDPFPRTIEMGHIVPPDITETEEKIIVDTISKAVVSLGMENGAFNAEIMIRNGEGYVIEVNGRLAGDFIVSHLLRPTTGQDMEEAVINISLGIPPEKAKRNYKKHGMISFFNLPEGKIISKIKDFSHLEKNKNIVWTYLFFKEGDKLPEVLHMGHRSGFVIVLADSRKDMLELSENTKKTIIDSVEFV